MKYIISFIVIVVVNLLCIHYWKSKYSNNNSSSSSSSNVIRRLGDQIQWGETFQPVESNLIRRECVTHGYPVCCALVSNTTTTTTTTATAAANPNVNLYERNFEKVNNDNKNNINHYDHRNCPRTREYIPSSYELEHINKAKEFNTIENDDARYNAILDYAFSYEQVEHSRNWLKRVEAHMNSSSDPPFSIHDERYLSRFVETYNCKHVNKTFVRTEWIEPLTIHSRHPFAWCHSQCPVRRKGYCANLTSDENSTHIVNSDYVIVASSSANNSEIKDDLKPHQSNYDKKYFFDAGTSTFNSGLVWFLCAYAQRHMVFNQFYGWEYTLLEPSNFWSLVPPLLKPIYHFFNIPVNSKYDDSDSVLRFIEQIAKYDDFVSFKLDIDTPEVEIPIALYIAEHPELAQLLDEFFFELHYRCDIMMWCGWGNEMPKQFQGLELTKIGAMQFFQRLRYSGIRAHFWV